MLLFLVATVKVFRDFVFFVLELLRVVLVHRKVLIVCFKIISKLLNSVGELAIQAMDAIFPVEVVVAKDCLVALVILLGLNLMIPVSEVA